MDFMYEVRDVVDNELKSIVTRFLESNFLDEEDDLAELQNLQKTKYFSKPKGIIIARNNNLIVGVVYLFIRDIEYSDLQIKIGGLGSLCTHKEYRRKGIASNLIKKAIEYLKEEKCQVAFLNTEISRHGVFFSQFGFRSINKNYSYLDKDNKINTDNGGMMANLGSIETFTQIIKAPYILEMGKGSW